MNRNGSSADGEGHALRFRDSHTANGKHARQACFQHLRSTRKRPQVAISCRIQRKLPLILGPSFECTPVS
jgi:hypothetical protein